MPTAVHVLNLHQTAVAVAACARAGHVPLVIGPPGIAKTTLMRAVAPVIGKALGLTDYPVDDCILSNRASVDVGGYPVVLHEGSATKVELRLFGTLRDAAERPSLLFLDELTTCSPATQGPALRVVRERVAGEIALHPLTRVVCAANDPEHAPSGIQLTAPLVNRLVVLHCRPDVEEVAMYFCDEPGAALDGAITLPNDELWMQRRGLLRVTAGTLFRTRPDLLVLDAPPDDAIHNGAPFSSPRAWDMCCDVLAALPEGVGHADPVTRAIVLGTLGEVGLAFMSLIRARAHLPTVEELLTAPDRCPLPDPTKAVVDVLTGQTVQIGRDAIFAVISLVMEAARQDSFAAWVYIDRVTYPEVKAAVVRALTNRTYVDPTRHPAGSPWYRKGQKIMLDAGDELVAGISGDN